jgi:5-methylcytosine-specific restriction endonuclease McrA
MSNCLLSSSSAPSADVGLDQQARQAGPDANYVSATYRRNRAIALKREPACYWKFLGCTLKSTQADHLVPVSRGGSNRLDNLVGSCQHCNEARGRAAGNAAKRRRR